MRKKHFGIALGLASLLPSVAFADQSVDNLQKLLKSQENDSQTSKVQNLSEYSPVVDLRSTRAPIYDQVFENGFNNQNTDLSFGENTRLSILKTSGGPGSFDWIFNVSNNATVIMDFDTTDCIAEAMVTACGGFEGNNAKVFFQGEGTFVLNANSNPDSPLDNVYGFIDSVSDDPSGFGITSNFIFKASGNIGSFLRVVTGPRSIPHEINAPYLEIDMDNNGANKNTKKHFFLAQSYFGAEYNIYLNADTSNPYNAKNDAYISKITGNIYLGPNTYAHLYANFANSASFLKGNFEAGEGSVSNVTFKNGSSMTGNINIFGNGNHNLTFDGASFVGAIKTEKGSNEKNGPGESTNATITFKNTSKQTIGDGKNDIVASTFKGTIVGEFDMSAYNSATNLQVGSTGTKGFQGIGTNLLIFDFKDNAKTSSARKVLLSGGNADSLYVIKSFKNSNTPILDLGTATPSNPFATQLEKAGLKIALRDKEASNHQVGDHLSGTLFFQQTDIKVGDNDNALFAKSDNIIGTGKDLNDLALGAMFGNALWNDANKDGVITQDEITNAGRNYKLSGGTANGTGIDSKTSTGNIGKASDNIKKHVAFIFANDPSQGGYVFNGEHQGYSGTIAGGTEDSKYYFANAGYLTRTQVESASGDLVLFNTAFRGDLGVKNKAVSIMLDFSNGRNGLRAETGNDNANIVGAGSKDVIFNFTDNNNKEKYKGYVIGDATKDNANPDQTQLLTADSDTAKYTMLNLKAHSADNQLRANGGMLSANTTSFILSEAKNPTTTLIDVIQGAGVTNLNKKDKKWESGYENGSEATPKTDVSLFSTTKTTLSLVGTSLDASNIDFKDYIYDLSFGSEMGDLEGIAIQDSKLKGTLDLSTNENPGHKITLKGNSIDSSAEIKFGTTPGNVTLSYNDIIPSDTPSAFSTAPTLKLTGLDQSKYLQSGELTITNTNLEGNLWANEATKIDLNFDKDQTWKMSESGLRLASGSNLVINGKIIADGVEPQNTAPVLKIYTDQNQGDIQLINTGATLKWQLGKVSSEKHSLGKSFDLRGTSLEVTYHSNVQNGSLNGIHGNVSSGAMTFVFAKGTNLDTTMTNGDSGGANLKITDQAVDKNHTGQMTYNEELGKYVYDGNYIAESSGKFTKTATKSKIEITYIGENSHNLNSFNGSSAYGNDSKMTFVNASNGEGIDASKIGTFFNGANNSTATITLEGTSLKNGNSIVGSSKTNQQVLSFKMTFVNDGASNGSAYVDNKYVDEKYEGLATTNANGALKDSILKVAKSKLEGGIDFKDANFDVLFVGDQSQQLSESNVFKNGSSTSTLTFRDSDLKAGNGTSSIQDIRGTIAFDLSHKGEDMTISGTLSNMFKVEGQSTTGKYQTKFGASRGDNLEPLVIDKLVFVKMDDVTKATTLTTLKEKGNYFDDVDVFGETLSKNDYSSIGYISDLKDNENSSLTFGNGEIAISGSNQEIIFIGSESHGFGKNNGGATKLGDSTGATLTFIDAGELKVANIVNDSSGQKGKGTINLVGSTQIELQDISTSLQAPMGYASAPLGLQRAGTPTLTLYSNDSGTITGEGITINAVFTGQNVLGSGVKAKDEGSQEANNLGNIASNVNIGQTGEKTIYHILFDYTESMKDKPNLGFGKYQVYQGTIAELSADSTIKFKNSGYIEGEQIQDTKAQILLDNTQLKADFRGDIAILDYRNGKTSIAGNILTSDTKNSGAVLSRKILTFDLTGTGDSGTKLESNDYAIQAGYKVAPEYTNEENSILTFQNIAGTLELGKNTKEGFTNPSAFLQAVATTTGFSAFGKAKTDGSDFNTGDNKNKSYILAGTELVFEGVNITATSDKTITENTYSLSMKFDKSENRGTTALGETFQASALTANKIIMGEGPSANVAVEGEGSMLIGAEKQQSAKPRNLSLSFTDQGSLNATNKTLEIQLKDNAIFNLETKSSNGKIGKFVLSENTSNDGLTLDANSKLLIGKGSADFEGVFNATNGNLAEDPKKQGRIEVFFGDVIEEIENPDTGEITQSFKANNKIRGVLAGKGDMLVTIADNAILQSSNPSHQASFITTAEGKTVTPDLLIDASNAKQATSHINLSGNNQGTIQVKGVAVNTPSQPQPQTPQAFTNLNLSNFGARTQNENGVLDNSPRADLILGGAFDLGRTNIVFDQTTSSLSLTDNTYFKVSHNSSITLEDVKLIPESTGSTPKTLTITALGETSKYKVDLKLTNLDPNLTVRLTNLSGAVNPSDWGNQGIWDIRGTNIELPVAFWAEASDNLKNFVFAKGAGTETTQTGDSGSLKLSELTTADKINESALSGELATKTNGEKNVRNLIFKNANLTFIGKDSFKIDADKQLIDGTGGKITFGFYNNIIKSEYTVFDNTNNGEHNNLGKTKAVQDVITLSGTDTFNLSLQKKQDTTGANNSTISAIFVNGANLQTTGNVRSTDTQEKSNTILSGEKYIDSTQARNEALKATLAQYETTNAGGALSSDLLKTLQSSAYGNISLESSVIKQVEEGKEVEEGGVTATMRFIGEGSHSFDGKTIVENSGTSAKVYRYVGTGEASTPSTTADWKEIKIGTGTPDTTPANGVVYLDSANPSSLTPAAKYAMLSGGNSASRFDFDHTTVALDLVKFANGETLVYNSNVSGEIAVTKEGGIKNNGDTTLKELPKNSQTTLFFNAKMSENPTNGEQQYTNIAKTFIDYNYTSAETGYGINLDLGTEHKLKQENLSEPSVSGGLQDVTSQEPGKTKKLGTTEKQTNLIFIGKGSIEGVDASKAGIDLSFLPDTNASDKYSYTIISGGEIDSKDLQPAIGKDEGGNVQDPSGVNKTVFGDSKVQLVDTYIIGERNFAQVGFIDTNLSGNQKSSWGGTAEQFLIYDFHNAVNNGNLNKGNAGGEGAVIRNTSLTSRYIFTSIFAGSDQATPRVLEVGSPNGFKTALNTHFSAKNSQGFVTEGMTAETGMIGKDVKGYLGLRGVSVKGDLDETLATADTAGQSQSTGNSLDLVFNSTSDISYIDGFDASGKHTFKIERIGYNKVANLYGINNEQSNISGYAQLIPGNGGTVTIKGNAHKDIVFIGEDAVQGGFDKLKIEGGSSESNYTFHSVGKLSQIFLDNVGLHKVATTEGSTGGMSDTKATLGNFTFVDSAIDGDINVDKNEVQNSGVGGAGDGAGEGAGGALRSSTPNTLVFKNVDYSGKLSGTLEKQLTFGANSDNITIQGGSDTSSYDFSALAGKTIHLNVDLRADATNTAGATPDQTGSSYAPQETKYLQSSIKGFEEGHISLVGSLNLATNEDQLQNPLFNEEASYSNNFAFHNDASWTLTADSSVMNLTLSNLSDTNYNLDLSSAPRQTQDAYRTLKVGTLTSSDAQVLLGTQINTQDQKSSKADRIETNVLESGTLYVTAKDVALEKGEFDTSSENAIVLVSATTSYGQVKGAERKIGLSYVSTRLEHQVSPVSDLNQWTKVEDESQVNTSDSHRWVLAGFDSKVNQELVDESGFVVSTPYRMFIIETNNLNKRMGDLRDNDYTHGTWIRVFNGQDSGEGIKNLYTNIQLGYDYATSHIGAKNYTGLAFSTSIVSTQGQQYKGDANTYSLAVYNSYIHDNGMYVDSIAKYLYTDQKLQADGGAKSQYGNHALSLGLEVGYRENVGKTGLFFEPQLEMIAGYINGVKDIKMGIINKKDVYGELESTPAFNLRAGLVLGYSLKTQSGFRADFRVGGSIVNDVVLNPNPIRLTDGIVTANTTIKNDTKGLLNVGTNLILTDKWRVYIDAERSFGGSRTTEYQVNVGARFSFGDTLKSKPIPDAPTPLKLKNKDKDK